MNDRRVRAYAEKQGGVTLQYWKLALARVWGDPFMMTNDEIARCLGVSESEIEQIVAETSAALGWNGPAVASSKKHGRGNTGVCPKPG